MVRDMKRQMDRSGAVSPGLQPAQLHYPQDTHPPAAEKGTRPPPSQPPILHPPPGTRHPQSGEWDSRPMPPPPLQATPPHPPRELYRSPVVQDRNIADDDWLLPPPPVAFPNDDYEPPRVQPTPLGPQPADTVQNLRERLLQLEARLSLAPSVLSEPHYHKMFKYKVLCDHLKFEEALLIADSYSNSLFPYSDTMASLTKHYGQPHQLSLQRIAELMEEPAIRAGDTVAFRMFALRVRALVGMLEQLAEDGRIQLK
ncbi:hypothetical protein D5F01_LYC05600 [Larimichthys crocea]|uniref:Uncharacterized protein n=1 Tax=Larimichthys crocea TaxID=215358 RepID=A0A6G0IZW5_LARCR|nr:hypothetical protein D5F01_LYC05600 [Larimichthys crocea]